jgi:hypothetical protein
MIKLDDMLVIALIFVIWFFARNPDKLRKLLERMEEATRRGD